MKEIFEQNFHVLSISFFESVLRLLPDVSEEIFIRLSWSILKKLSDRFL